MLCPPILWFTLWLGPQQPGRDVSNGSETKTGLGDAALAGLGFSWKNSGVSQDVLVFFILASAYLARSHFPLYVF